MACVFLISVGLGRPLIGKLAGEFWPMTPEVAARPRVLRLFRNLTLMWGALNLASAALTLTFLVSLPLGVFLAAKQVSAFGITAVGVFVTVSMSLTTGRREGLAAVALWQPVPAVRDEGPYLFE
jgi:ABC-type phosphate/phosphonate transport system permease subunit